MVRRIFKRSGALVVKSKKNQPVEYDNLFPEDYKQQIDENVSEFKRYFQLGQAIERQKMLADLATAKRIRANSWAYFLTFGFSNDLMIGSCWSRSIHIL